MTSASPANLESPLQILRFIAQERKQGRSCALIVVTGLSGGSMRQVGSLSAVSVTGDMAGYVSNGCIDSDVIANALAAIEDGAPRNLRYGAGSPFVDLQLPCGGSVDILIDPAPDASTVEAAVTELSARRAINLNISVTSGVLPNGEAESADFGFLLKPVIKLIVAGKGPSLHAMVEQGVAAEFEVAFATPDEEEERQLVSLGARVAFPLNSPWDSISFETDPWTAVITLFHDHIWETQILSAAVQSDAFYIGCLGSERTQAIRKQVLAEEGLSTEQIARVRGPIGLVPSMRSAKFLAISAISEVIKVFAERMHLAEGADREVVHDARSVLPSAD